MTAVSGAQYTVASGDGRGITLDDVLAFVAQVERLDPSLMNAKLWAATYGQDLKTLERLQVRGGIPTDVPAPRPDAEKAPPASDELLAENEALHYRLDRIRQHHDDSRHAKIGLQVMRDLIEQELNGHPPAAAGITGSQHEMVALYLEQWRRGELGAVNALQNISGLLGLNLLPPDDGDDD